MITSLGFRLSNHDSTLFYRCKVVNPILLSLYVDEMIITGDDIDSIVALKLELACCYTIKRFGFTLLLSGY